MDAQIILSKNITTFFSMLEFLSNDVSLKSFIIILKTYGLDQQQANNKGGLEKVHRSKIKVISRDLEKEGINLWVVKHEPQHVKEQKLDITITKKEKQELEHQ